MKKYKISESNLKEFWGLFGKKNKPSKLQSVIDDDPVLKKLDKEAQDIISDFYPHLKKVQKEDPKLFKFLQDQGFISKDFN